MSHERPREGRLLRALPVPVQPTPSVPHRNRLSQSACTWDRDRRLGPCLRDRRSARRGHITRGGGGSSHRGSGEWDRPLGSDHGLEVEKEFGLQDRSRIHDTAQLVVCRIVIFTIRPNTEYPNSASEVFGRIPNIRFRLPSSPNTCFLSRPVRCCSCACSSLTKPNRTERRRPFSVFHGHGTRCYMTCFSFLCCYCRSSYGAACKLCSCFEVFH